MQRAPLVGSLEWTPQGAYSIWPWGMDDCRMDAAHHLKRERLAQAGCVVLTENPHIMTTYHVILEVAGWLMDGCAGCIDGVESFEGSVEAGRVEPQPGEQDQAWVHVPFFLVAVVASQNRVLGAA